MNNTKKENIAQKEKPSIPFRLGFILYITSLLIYPYIFIIHHFFPYTYSHGLDDKSIFVAGITLVLIFAFLLQGKKIIAKLGKKELYFYFFIFVSLLITRFLVYQDPITVLIKYRLFILPIIYIGLACYYLSDQKKRQLVIKIIFWQALIQAVIGIFLWNFVYTGIVNHEIFEFSLIGGRMGGTLVSANLFPAFLLLGAFILISPYAKWRLGHLVKIILLLVLMWPIIYSNSRLPFLVGIVILLISFKDALLAKKSYFAKTLVITLLIAIFFAASWMPSALETIISRVTDEGPSLRLIKYKQGLSGVLENVAGGLLIGATQERMHERTMVIRDEGLAFSDNSFITSMQLLGVLITFLYLLLFIAIIKRTSVIKGNSFFLLYFIATSFFNSFFGMDFWTIFVFAALYGLQPQPESKVTPQAKIVYEEELKQLPERS